jgi:putative flippase GtrA
MLRSGAFGLLNTALGYAVILAGLAPGLGDIVSNAAGLVPGFFLNRQGTFIENPFVHLAGNDPESSTAVNAKWPGAAI